MSGRTACAFFFSALLAIGCGRRETMSAPAQPSATPQEAVGTAPVAAAAAPGRDPFSYANYDEVRVSDLALDIAVNFDSRTIDGSAVLTVSRVTPDAGRLVLDTNDLEIAAIEAETGDSWTATTFSLGSDDPNLGARLEIALPADAKKVRIAYRTSPGAEGLQWLEPAQTAGGRHPFMYSQNQAINARSMAPVQDTPAVRMTYSATVRTPPDLLALMSAEQDGGPRDGEYQFRMPQPVPAYLLAIAVGDLDFRPISETIGVYAEPEIVDAAAREFSDTPEMEAAASKLYGQYRWGRYDLLVLPPSFPFGGMENPRLSFMTPTLLAGDKSLVGTVAHELAHSWSGNLVTNATWSDAWLNEGVTSYVENRLMEAVFGPDRAVAEQSLALGDLRKEIEELDEARLSRLQLPSDIDHPDDAFSGVAYAKGQFFLHFLEARYGRDAFDGFLKSWFDSHAFAAATTADFRTMLIDALAKEYPDAASIEEIDEWLYGEGVPSTLVAPSASAFETVEAELSNWLAGKEIAETIRSDNWTTQQWLHFINALPADISTERLEEIDTVFNFTDSRNAEIAFAWQLRALKANYAPAFPAIESFLGEVGRGKFIYPLYQALVDNDRRAFAERVYEKSRPLYHPIAQRRIDEILQPLN